MNSPETDFRSLFQEFDRALKTAWGPDRGNLIHLLRAMRAAFTAQKPFDRNLTRFQNLLKQSQTKREQRVQQRPKITYDLDLPILSKKAEIESAIRLNPVVIVCGETGSGKSTQLPKLCLEMGRGIDGLIGHTQPRRIAARSVASRLAEELRVPLGSSVGFKVRFADATNDRTYVKLMTDGILLAESQSDRQFRNYDTLIIDEAHERSLNIDFLLGYLKRLMPQRPDLRVIITSATIDANRFSEHFGSPNQPAPVIEVSGRSYPVEILYRPLLGDEDSEKRREKQDDPQDGIGAIREAIEELSARGPGDVLVFLPTEREIHETAKSLRGQGRSLGGIDVLPLYARLSTQEQQRIFAPSSQRRIVLATNVAESSLTVPGIRYVVDTGTARISRYAPRSRLQRLPIEAVSQASANQRAGRCGRLGPGVCIRLYSEEDYRQRDRFTVPEIQRTNLAAVILQTMSLQLGHIEDFPFLDPPKPEAVRDGYKTLFELGAVDDTQQITPLGKQLGRLPVDPRIGRIIHAAHEGQCLNEVLIIASALEVQDPRERPLEKQQAADEAHARFLDSNSDFTSYLKVWDFFHELKEKLSKSQLRKACQQNFLSFTRLREWIDVHRELAAIVEELGWKIGPRHGDANAIHRALLTGFLSSIAMKSETGEYQVPGGQKAVLWPGSGLHEGKPKWIVSAELIETHRRFLRINACIDPSWIEALAPHLLTRTYSDPHWDEESLAVLAHEKVSLLGLPIIPRRRIRYHRVDPIVSRKMFIRMGLVEGQFPEPPEFLKHNRELVQELEALQARLRRAVLIKSEDDRAAWYETQIPPEIVDGRHLVNWYRKQKVAQPQLLLMTRADLLLDDFPIDVAILFPEHLEWNRVSLPLEYRLDPGAKADGITLIVPQAALNQLDEQRLAWLVPGLLHEKVEALIRSLPKDARIAFVPIPETVQEVVPQLTFGSGHLLDALTTVLNERMGVRISRTQFQESRLPDHLRMNFRVVDAQGKTLAEARDLAAIRQQFGAAAAHSFALSDDPRWQRSRITTWDFGSLPMEVEVLRNGIPLKGYPALIDDGETVSLTLRDAAARALWETTFGIRRLYCLACKRELKTQVEYIPQLNNWTLLGKIFPQPFPVRQHLLERVADVAFLQGHSLPRSRDQFLEWQEQGRERLQKSVSAIVQLMVPLMQSASELKTRLERFTAPAWQPSQRDLLHQASQLFEPGWLIRTPWPWLCHYPRYLRGMLNRMEKLSANAVRDSQQIPLLNRLWLRYAERRKAHAERHLVDAALEEHRWLLEEFRIAIFAQDLGTVQPVSEKRLDKHWEQVSP